MTREINERNVETKKFELKKIEGAITNSERNAISLIMDVLDEHRDFLDNCEFCFKLLDKALDEGKFKVFQFLVGSMGLEAVDYVDFMHNETLLIRAAKACQSKVCEMLIQLMSRKAINQVDIAGRTAFDYAEQNNMTYVCKLITGANGMYTHLTATRRV